MILDTIAVTADTARSNCDACLQLRLLFLLYNYNTLEKTVRDPDMTSGLLSSPQRSTSTTKTVNFELFPEPRAAIDSSESTVDESNCQQNVSVKEMQ